MELGDSLNLFSIFFIVASEDWDEDGPCVFIIGERVGIGGGRLGTEDLIAIEHNSCSNLNYMFISRRKRGLREHVSSLYDEAL
jgi:hypothetical protein